MRLPFLVPGLRVRSIYGYPLKFQRTRSPNSRNGNRMVVRPRPRRNGKRTG